MTVKLLEKVLFIGAHPDDIEIGCGGFILRNKDNFDTHFIVVTDGGYTYNPDIRMNELTDSRIKLNASLVGLYHKYEDNYIVNQYSELVTDLESAINQIKPSLIFTQGTGDFHHDHFAVSNATMEATRKSKASIFTYENPHTRNFKPNFFVDITEQFPDKLNLLSVYKSQIEKKRINLDSITYMAKFRATNYFDPSKYYEAFDLIRAFD